MGEDKPHAPPWAGGRPEAEAVGGPGHLGSTRPDWDTVAVLARWVSGGCAHGNTKQSTPHGTGSAATSLSSDPLSPLKIVITDI